MSSVWTVVGSLREAALFWMDHWRRRLRAGSFIVPVVVVWERWVVSWLCETGCDALGCYESVLSIVVTSVLQIAKICREEVCNVWLLE